MAPYMVRDRLFIGNITDAAEVLQKGSAEFTHVLSLLSSASVAFFSDWRPEVVVPTVEVRKVFAGECDGDGSPPMALSPEKLLCSVELAGPELKLTRMAVPLRDMEEENLLDCLDVCWDFIDGSRKEGTVLVHCFAGVSRSAAVITSYLMRNERKSLEDALESLQQSCESICPNDGFLEQLKMFEEMEFKIDRASPIYKRFRMKVLGDSFYRGLKIDSSILGADPGVPMRINSGVSSHKEDEKTIAYRCKKCRRMVALQDNVVGHTPGEGETCFQWQRGKVDILMIDPQKSALPYLLSPYDG